MDCARGGVLGEGSSVVSATVGSTVPVNVTDGLALLSGAPWMGDWVGKGVSVSVDKSALVFLLLAFRARPAPSPTARKQIKSPTRRARFQNRLDSDRNP